MYEAYGKKFADIQAAKKYVKSLPYWAEAISKDGLIQTVSRDNYPICQRQIVVDGLGSNRTVSVSNWYSI